MKTIDVRVKEVLKKELKKTSQAEKDSFNKIAESHLVFDSIQPAYTIPTRDTIGKNIYFNTERK
jgi:hypothetical protein